MQSGPSTWSKKDRNMLMMLVSVMIGITTGIGFRFLPGVLFPERKGSRVIFSEVVGVLILLTIIYGHVRAELGSDIAHAFAISGIVMLVIILTYEVRGQR